MDTLHASLSTFLMINNDKLLFPHLNIENV
uniref:Uncharacterized protein n=1 Tax=Siphoviridae sp. ctTXt1 TaxID=2825520 RepID=A0A8S5P8R0_9CAUD|nr:MAG TPA: hypothetical protein [Siphoviridae sp. ctTXt1]